MSKEKVRRKKKLSRRDQNDSVMNKIEIASKFGDCDKTTLFKRRLKQIYK